MISAQIFRNLYVDLYKELRKYLWDIDAVTLIVDLETETHKAFPDVIQLNSILGRLKRQTISTSLEDEELSDAFDSFEEALKDVDDFVTLIKYPTPTPLDVEKTEDEDEVLEEAIDDNLEDGFEGDVEEESSEETGFGEFEEEVENENQ